MENPTNVEVILLNIVDASEPFPDSVADSELVALAEAAADALLALAIVAGSAAITVK